MTMMMFMVTMTVTGDSDYDDVTDDDTDAIDTDYDDVFDDVNSYDDNDN